MIQRWGGGVAAKRVKEFQRNVAKASSKDQLKARSKLTRTDADGLHFVSDPPLLVPVAELFSSEVDAQAIEESIHETLRSYRRTLQADRRHLLESYRFVDLARKVVGVGSVGTRAWVALFVGASPADTLDSPGQRGRSIGAGALRGPQFVQQRRPAGRGRAKVDASGQ